MSWKCICAEIDLLCYQKIYKKYAIRIEARQSNDGWKVHKSYYNDKGLSVTDTFDAKDRSDMERLIKVLRDQKEPTLKFLQERMLETKKSISLRLERGFKEYNIEKWFFSMDNQKEPNFILLRFNDDAIDVDIVMHQRLQEYERTIGSEIARVLGLQDEDIMINYYYFKEHKQSALFDRASQGNGQTVEWYSE